MVGLGRVMVSDVAAAIDFAAKKLCGGLVFYLGFKGVFGRH